MISFPSLCFLAWFTALIAVIYNRQYTRNNLLGLPISLIALLWILPVSKISFLLGTLGAGGFIALYTLQNFRTSFLTMPLLEHARKQLPTLSETEQTALNAGHTWWEAEVFQGSPNWQTLKNYPNPQFTPEEQAFLDGPVIQLTRMIDDWQITHHLLDMPENIWQFLKDHRFFALIIPKRYGGLEFSAYAHSEIIHRIASKSITVASTVSVPNSLGPAELLLHYGTPEQKDYYLPRLATGQEIPCFALTSPEAGSDAGSIPDFGIVKKGLFEGQEILGIVLQFNKRYITLAPIATVIGLAFKLYDPDHLIGEKTEYGITCALIPRNTPGITIGKRHFPLNAVFQNGPIQGKDVFVPLDWIIGGLPMAGQGWRMLVECLSAGRAISLPATSSGGAKVAVATSTAYARIRHQFNQPLCAFEGVGFPLSDMTASLYVVESVRRFTAHAIDMGNKPAVASAISKYHVTEICRKITNTAIDIHGGKGICMGPKNYLARSYQNSPIAITVEGANILTRNMIIFGQGAVRCHPYLLTELSALAQPNSDRAIKEFDQALTGHIGYFLSHFVRTFVFGITRAKIVSLPVGYPSQIKKEIQKITQASSILAFVGDLILIIWGGALKRKESLSARLGDMLSMLYLSTLSVKRYMADGAHQADLPILKSAITHCLNEFENALDDILYNFPIPGLKIFLKMIIYPFGRNMPRPGDSLQQTILDLMTQPSDTRKRLLSGLDLEPSKKNPMGLMEEALPILIAAAPIEKKARKIISLQKDWRPESFMEQLKKANETGLISCEEFVLLEKAHALRQEIIAVDDFTSEELRNPFPASSSPIKKKVRRKKSTDVSSIV